MSKNLWFWVAIIATVLGVPCAANMVARDLLGWIGGFESSCYSSWVSCYSGADYDWNAAGRWSNGPTYSGGVPWRWGYNAATANDSVAEGWTRESSLNPETKLVYKLVDNGGGKCQYFAVKGVASGDASAYLLRDFAVGKEPYKLNVGDIVTFSMDSIKMADYSSLSLTYQLGLGSVDGSKIYQDLTPSTTPFSSSVTGTIAPGAKAIRVMVSIFARDGTGLQTPGIYVDGAHLKIRRGGSQLTEEVPIKRNRSIKTMKVFVTSADDAYYVAGNYDRVDLQYESDYWFARRVKYYNPDIKVYLYEAPWVTDWREPKFKNRDGLWSNTPVGMAFVLKHDAESGKPDWLYPNGGSWFGLGDKAYYAHLGDTSFQNVWTANALGKVARYKLDGLFIDGAVAAPSGKFPGIEPWAVQSFLHTVMKSRPAVVDVIHNMGALNLLESPAVENPSSWIRWKENGLICFDPSWTPHSTGDYTVSNHYTANSADNTFDGMYQEVAFWYYGDGRNWYNQTYAANCLNDMDTVKKWNLGLPENRKKWMHCLPHGADRPGKDNAYGIDGWLNFGLCCYLLGQNDWTTLGVAAATGSQSVLPTAPFDETANLGEPAGYRAMNGAVGQRQYYGTDAGAKGGIVVANIADTKGYSYTPEFDVVDQDKVFHPAGSAISLGAHTGRILYHQNNYRYVSVVTAPAEGKVITNANYTIQGHVAANRPGLALPPTVQVKIDDGDWTDCSVDSGGTWSMSWNARGVSQGSHTISCRAYVSSTDYEPSKHDRSFSVERH